MAARLTPVAERINVESQRMILARSVDALSGLAALLSVWLQLHQVCRFGARWPPRLKEISESSELAQQRWASQSNSGRVTAREDGYNSVRSARLALLWSN
jgi:hypothetical protein